MTKIKVIIGFSIFVLFLGMLLMMKIFVRFIPVLGGDSIIPQSMVILSNFTTWDYLQVYLSLVFFVTGLLIYLIELGVIMKKRRI